MPGPRFPILNGPCRPSSFVVVSSRRAAAASCRLGAVALAHTPNLMRARYVAFVLPFTSWKGSSRPCVQGQAAGGVSGVHALCKIILMYFSRGRFGHQHYNLCGTCASVAHGEKDLPRLASLAAVSIYIFTQSVAGYSLPSLGRGSREAPSSQGALGRGGFPGISSGCLQYTGYRLNIGYQP